ncbi:MAG: transposase [Beijerinckiaceae bacterium]
MRSLAGLVPAAVSGVLGDVTIAAPAGIEGLGEVADRAGCRLVEERGAGAALAAAFKSARYGDVLTLAAARVPPAGFEHELDSLMRAGVRQYLMREEPQGLIGRLLPSCCPVALLVAPRAVLAPFVGREPSGSGLGYLARLAGKTRTMKTRALVVG